MITDTYTIALILFKVSRKICYVSRCLPYNRKWCSLDHFPYIWTVNFFFPSLKEQMEGGVSWLDPSKTKISTIFLEKTNSSRNFFHPNYFLLQSLILINSSTYFWVPCSKQLSQKLNDLIYSFIASTCANQTKRFYLLNWNEIISLLCQHIQPKEKKY